MKDSIELTKNIKDLQHDRLLNEQNALLAFLGTLLVANFFSDAPFLAPRISRQLSLVLLFLVSFMVYWFYRNKLDCVEEEIKNL